MDDSAQLIFISALQLRLLPTPVCFDSWDRFGQKTILPPTVIYCMNVSIVVTRNSAGMTS